MAGIVCLRVLLVELDRRTDQKIRKIAPGLIAIEYERAIEFRIGIDVHLFDAYLDSGLESMAAQDSGKAKSAMFVKTAGSKLTGPPNTPLVKKV